MRSVFIRCLFATQAEHEYKYKYKYEERIATTKYDRQNKNCTSVRAYEASVQKIKKYSMHFSVLCGDKKPTKHLTGSNKP